MAQGKDQSFASRLFHRCRKSNPEQKGQENEVPHISEFTIMWDKFSKCFVLLLHLKCVCSSEQDESQLMFVVFVCRRTDLDEAYKKKQVAY